MDPSGNSFLTPCVCHSLWPGRMSSGQGSSCDRHTKTLPKGRVQQLPQPQVRQMWESCTCTPQDTGVCMCMCMHRTCNPETPATAGCWGLQ